MTATSLVARAAERLPVRLDSDLLLASGLRTRIRLRDLSPLGFMAECGTFASIGSDVRLDCGRLGSFRAEIRWALVGWFGAKFVDPLAADQMARLLEAGRAR